MDTHLLADQVGHGRRPLVDVLATTELVDRNRRLVAVGNGGDHILRAESGIPAKEHLFIRGLESGLVDHRHVPLVEVDTENYKLAIKRSKSKLKGDLVCPL